MGVKGEQHAPPAGSGSALTRGQQTTIAIAGLTTLLSAILHQTSLTVLTFIATAVALAVLATLVGAGTEQIGSRLGPGATGVLQSALGNLPELFFGIFALRQGPDLVPVVQAALIGSVLGNSLLVLGLAIAFGGLRHGTQRFNAETPRNIATLTLLAVAAITVPTLANQLHTSASLHEDALSIACAVVLLIVFFSGIPFSLQGGPTRIAIEGEEVIQRWSIGLAIAVLLGASVAAAFVSSWFVDALTPATQALHIAPGFAGLVIVALAGNAVENVVGVQLMARNRPDYAISVILNSSLQVALALIPALVLLSFVVGGAHLTLVLPPLLLGALFLSTLLGALVVYDGESTWLEGFALMGLYAIVAAGFWWG
jgi:Ca2+:H+ antiporter